MLASATTSVRFFDHALASPAFLLEQGITHFHRTRKHCLFAEQDAAGAFRLYALVYCEGLYLIDPATVSRVAKAPELTSEELKRLATRWLPRQQDLTLVGQRLLQEFDDDPTLPSLTLTAYAAARAAGATAATGRWLAKFVSGALLGCSFDYAFEYRTNGLYIGPLEAKQSFHTEQQQLKKLQAAGLALVQSERGAVGATIRFQQAALAPALSLALAPEYFSCLFY